MNFMCIFPTILGLMAGTLSAIVIYQYQKNYGQKIDSLTKHQVVAVMGEQSLNQGDYATGGTSFYFVLPDDEHTHKVLPVDSIAKTVNTDSKNGFFDPRLNSTLLYKNVKILCFVILPRRHIQSSGKAIKATWIGHCNKFIFLSSEYNAEVGVININLPEGQSESWLRSKVALKYIYDTFKGEEFDWFVKVGHDSFLVLENLRYLLLMHKANIPNYIGHVFSGPKSGGSVFVMNKQALELITPTLKDNKPLFGGVADDLELEGCFKAAGAFSSNQGKDIEGVQRFRMIVPDHNLPMNTKGFATWYWRYIHSPSKKVSKQYFLLLKGRSYACCDSQCEQ